MLGVCYLRLIIFEFCAVHTLQILFVLWSPGWIVIFLTKKYPYRAILFFRLEIGLDTAVVFFCLLNLCLLVLFCFVQWHRYF